MRLLVTGGAGYIGSVVAYRLLAAGHQVTVVDDLSTGHADAVPEGAEFVRTGVDRLDPVLASGGYDGVLHFAAKSLVGESVEHPELYWHNNIAATIVLLDSVRATGVPRLVFSSTAATYGEPAGGPITEDFGAAPTNPYGASKLTIDLMLAAEARAHGLAAISLRYFNVAGALDSYGERHGTETHLIPIALQVAAGEREALSVYGEDYPTPDGTCVRDYIHVDDLATAHLLALAAAADPAGPVGAGTHRVYNLGNGAGFSVRQVVDAVRHVTGHPIPVRRADRRAGDPPTLVAASDRIRGELGWVPQRPGLEEMVADAWAFARRRHAASPGGAGT